MAGWVVVEPDKDWKAAGWLYRWVVSTIAANVDDMEVKRRLDAIVAANLPLLDLGEFTETQRLAMRAVIRDQLVDEAKASFPEDMVVDRDHAITYVGELAELVPSG
jgi:hypothetical protein